MRLVDDLTRSVARSGRLSPEQASQAVAAMLQFLAARLPSPLFGELQARLADEPAPGGPTHPGAPSHPAAPATTATPPTRDPS